MDAKLTFEYDRAADLLYINKCPAYAGQESEELGDEVIARLNPATGEIENLEVLFFSMRLLRSDLFELPVTADPAAGCEVVIALPAHHAMGASSPPARIGSDSLDGSASRSERPEDPPRLHRRLRCLKLLFKFGIPIDHELRAQ